MRLALSSPSLRGLKARIVVSFVLLMIGLQLAALVIINVAGERDTRNTVADELVTGERVFDRLLDQNTARLAQGSRILAADFGFRESIATRDRETIASALVNHGERIHADLMLLVGLDREVIADTLPTSRAGQRFSLAWMVDLAEAKGEASAIVSFDGTLYQIVVVPVLAPLPIAWVAMGFAIDDKVAQDLSKLTGLQVSFLSRSGGKWRVGATSLPATLDAALAEAFARSIGGRAGVPTTVTMDDSDYMSLVSSRRTDDANPVVTVLQRSLAEALEPFFRLRGQLILFALLATLLAILCSLVIAGGIARPVQALAALARRIAGGDYSVPVGIRRNDEIGELADAFEQMREGITERESRILDLAYRDGLTGLPNRALFADRLQQAIALSRRIGKPLTVLMMDLDRFKYVNDSLGHHFGDLLLIEVGRRLQQVVRRKSDTVARMGGDEFAILLPTEGPDGLFALVRQIQSALQEPMSIEGHLVDIHASLGIATSPEHGEDLVTLLRHADSAMYLAKRQGTGFATYDPRFDQDSRERLSLMSELRQAVERDELVLHYQPKIALADRRLRAAEVLLRWDHATRGFVSPDQFVPFAEQTGYITVITGWVINHALAQLRLWRADGLKIDLSINISTRDLMSATFPAHFAAMLTTHGCAAAWVVLEITETAIIDDPGHALENLDALHRLGCRISIDDFGTGYSSLAYLKRLPVDELKIDKSFVMGMADDPNDAVIVRSTIDLGHNMGLKVVAEGVETEATLRQLEAMGCDLLQGYLMSQPLSAEAFERWSRESPWMSDPPSLPVSLAA